MKNQRLGINSLALSHLIGVNHRALSKLATGTRPLPLKATASLATTYRIVIQLPEVSSPQHTSEELIDYEQKKAKCEVQIQLVMRELASKKEKYAQAVSSLDFLKKFVDVLPLTKQQQKWVDIQTSKAQQVMHKNGWQAQQAVMLKLTLLQAEAAFYNK